MDKIHSIYKTIDAVQHHPTYIEVFAQYHVFLGIYVFCTLFGVNL